MIPMETQIQTVELTEEQFQALVSAFASIMTEWAKLQTVLLFFAVFAAVGIFTFMSIFRE